MGNRLADYGDERLGPRQTVEVDGAILNVIDEGRSVAKNPRLLIQGLGCEAEVIWRPLLTELRAFGDNRQHLAFDTRGIGSSSGWPDSLEQMADDAAAVLASRANGPAEIVGHSLGGAVAMLLAARHPSMVHSLILMEAYLSIARRPVPASNGGPGKSAMRVLFRLFLILSYLVALAPKPKPNVRKL